MGAFLSDLKYGVRMISKHPGLAAISILALAFGLGLTTTMWSIVYGALMRPLPFDHGTEIVSVVRANPRRNMTRAPIEIHDFDEIVAAQRSFEGLSGLYTGTVNVSGAEGRPERYSGAFITTNTFRLLRVRPLLGRDFTDEEGALGGPMAVILGYDAWRIRFGGDTAVLGRTIRVNGSSALVIGVMPPNFKFPIREELWVPLRIDRSKRSE